MTRMVAQKPAEENMHAAHVKDGTKGREGRCAHSEFDIRLLNFSSAEGAAVVDYRAPEGARAAGAAPDSCFSLIHRPLAPHSFHKVAVPEVEAVVDWVQLQDLGVGDIAGMGGIPWRTAPMTQVPVEVSNYSCGGGAGHGLRTGRQPALQQHYDYEDMLHGRGRTLVFAMILV